LLLRGGEIYEVFFDYFTCQERRESPISDFEKMTAILAAQEASGETASEDQMSHQQSKQARKERLSKLMNKAASIEERLSRLNLTLQNPPSTELHIHNTDGSAMKSISLKGSNQESLALSKDVHPLSTTPNSTHLQTQVTKTVEISKNESQNVSQSRLMLVSGQRYSCSVNHVAQSPTEANLVEGDVYQLTFMTANGDCQV
jgi:seryl-tRNA synthetase